MAGAAEHGIQRLPWAWIGIGGGALIAAAILILVAGLCRAAARTPPDPLAGLVSPEDRAEIEAMFRDVVKEGDL